HLPTSWRRRSETIRTWPGAGPRSHNGTMTPPTTPPPDDPRAPIAPQTLAAALPEWTVETGAASRTVQAPSFPAAVELVRTVADSAEELGHHPDMTISYRTVTFTCTTHDAGGAL